MRFIFILLLFVITPASVSLLGEDFYLGPIPTGSGDGSSCANAKAADTFFNNPSNWGVGAGKISPGDTVHLCGTIPDDLVTQGAGSAGNVITIVGEAGSKMSAPFWPASFGAIDVANSYIRVLNVLVECTANGVLLANQVSCHGIWMAPGVHDVEIVGCTFSNLYVQVAGNDGPDLINSGVSAGGVGVNISIHNNSFSHMRNAVSAVATANGTTGFQFYSNNLSFYDHGVSGMAGFTGAIIRRNNFGGTVNWDSPSNIYHHDGIHIFSNTPGDLYDSFLIELNLINGDWGTNNTAMMFFEGDTTGGNTNAMKSFTVRNNDMLNQGSHVLNNGFMNPWGTNWTVENNTMVSTNGGQGMTITGVGQKVTNNVLSGMGTFITVNTPGAALDHNFYGNPSATATWRYTGTNYTSFPTWKTVTAGEQHSQSVANIQASISDGSLSAGSAAIGAGANLTLLFSDSFNGVTRAPSGPWDAGAYQIASAVVTNPPPIVITGKVTLRGGINLRVQ